MESAAQPQVLGTLFGPASSTLTSHKNSEALVLRISCARSLKVLLSRAVDSACERLCYIRLAPCQPGSIAIDIRIPTLKPDLEQNSRVGSSECSECFCSLRSSSRHTLADLNPTFWRWDVVQANDELFEPDSARGCRLHSSRFLRTILECFRLFEPRFSGFNSKWLNL